MIKFPRRRDFGHSVQRINRPNSFDDIQRIEAEIAGHPGCRFDALIGCGSAENAVFDAIAAEMVL